MVLTMNMCNAIAEANAAHVLRSAWHVVRILFACAVRVLCVVVHVLFIRYSTCFVHVSHVLGCELINVFNIKGDARSAAIFSAQMAYY